MNYERNRQVKLEESRRQRELSLQAEKEHSAVLKNIYRGKDSLNVSLVDQKRLEEEQLNEERKKLKEKIGSYAKYVKEMYWPKVSEQKKMELEQIKETLQSQKVRRSINPDLGDKRLNPAGTGRGSAAPKSKNLFAVD